MKKRAYSAGAVKHSFWFLEFRKVANLRLEGKSWDEIKKLNEEENIFGAPTALRAKQIYSTVSGRMKCLDDSFCPVFNTCDVSSQKLFALISVMAYDTLFGEFVYEVVREKMILGTNELTDSDIRIFFKNKQEQDEKVAGWTDATLKRLAGTYKTMLFESGMIDNENGRGKSEKKILRPILDPVMERWLIDQRMNYYVKALTGVR